MNDKHSEDYGCLICNKVIDDDGNLFCSVCRTKDWKIRFQAIKRLERLSNQKRMRKTSAHEIENPSPFYLKDYWSRRRESL